MRKDFYYDTILDAANICNLKREKKLLFDGINKNKKLAVYGSRNSGKTSLLKNVIIPKFKRTNKKTFVFFADLMEVKSLASINQRIQTSFEHSFAESFPHKNFLETVKHFLFNLRPKVSIDSHTGRPSLTLEAEGRDKALSFLDIFQTIREQIAPEVATLIVLDEFQDIAFVEEAQGLMRQALQEFKDVPFIIMGSKRHILSQLIARPEAPLAFFGEDIEFEAIPYKEYYTYIKERFKTRELKLEFQDAKTLQDALFRNPEAINIVCSYLCAHFSKKTVGPKQIFLAIEAVVKARQSRYEEYLSTFSAKEENVLVALAKQGPVKQPTSKDFLRQVSVTQGYVRIVIEQFMNRSIIDKSAAGYSLGDPLLNYYLKTFR